MKILRDRKYYVNYIDLVRYPVPSYFIFDNVCYGTKELVIISDLNSMEYIRNRQDIIDYDSVSSLSEKELDFKIKQAKVLLESYAKKYLNTSVNLRKNLYKDDKYVNGYRFHEYIYYGLLNYMNNKEEIDDFVAGIIPPRNSQLKKVK